MEQCFGVLILCFHSTNLFSLEDFSWTRDEPDWKLTVFFGEKSGITSSGAVSFPGTDKANPGKAVRRLYSSMGEGSEVEGRKDRRKKQQITGEERLV
jgi:hypothetical protein